MGSQANAAEAPTTERRWDRVVRRVGTDPIEPDLLRKLVDGDIAVLVLKDLLPSENFTRHRQLVNEMFDRASTTYYANGHLTTIGSYLAKHLSDVDEYFTESEKIAQVIADSSFTLGDDVRSGLARALSLRSLEVAEEPDGRRYADVCVRLHPDGVANPMHNDKIMRDAAHLDLVVSRLLYQLSCVICVQECDTGGEAKIYAKPWEAHDEKFKIPKGLGYEYGVVADVPAHEFKPQAEDVYLINPTYYHEILRVGGDTRVTVGFFLGFSDESLDAAVTWG
ncbi:hypothetical protein [Streptomyces sp. NPDC048057]|uniref:2OG-Fe(II)-dependent halogenase WelO5 family protein n=1 Tax=Streptomyces sp. NPDC048057 TaxID=3155628 RepID=UPI0033C8350A